MRTALPLPTDTQYDIILFISLLPEYLSLQILVNNPLLSDTFPDYSFQWELLLHLNRKAANRNPVKYYFPVRSGDMQTS